MAPIRSRVLLLLLLAAAAARADMVITGNEVIPCSLITADTHCVRLKLPQGSVQMLRTGDIYELRLADSARVAQFSALLPGTRVLLDSGRPVPPALERTSAVDARKAKPAALPAVPDEVQGWIDANRDARSCCLGLSWFGSTSLASGLLTFGGGMLGSALTEPGLPSLGVEGLEACLLISLGLGVGWGIGYTGPAAALLLSGSPPRNRLLGKPSAYVDAYTLEYRSTARRVALPLAYAGWATGGIAGLLLLLVVLAE